MGNQHPPLTDKVLKQTVETYQKHGLSVSATAKEIGVGRNTLRNRLKIAADKGFLRTEIAFKNQNEKSISLAAVAKQKKAFVARKRKGNWRKARKVELDYAGPFMLIAFGDQHFDDDGTALNLWEYWESHLDAANRVYGIHAGDFLNNWLRFLGFLWAEQEVRPPEAWELFKHYLPRFAPHSIAVVLGNHDLWNECGHMFRTLFGDYEMYVQPDAVRLEITQPGMKPVMVSIRHRWKGHSQWNAAHAIMKAARFGLRDDLLIGGDYHVSGEGKVVCPDTKRVTHCHQLASFKVLDRYADQLGLDDQHITPVQAFVVRPWLKQTDPHRICRFDDPADARAFLDIQRDKWEAKNDK